MGIHGLVIDLDDCCFIIDGWPGFSVNNLPIRSLKPNTPPQDLKQRRVAVIAGSGSQIAEESDCLLAKTFDDAVQLVLNNDASAYF